MRVDGRQAARNDSGNVKTRRIESRYLERDRTRKEDCRPGSTSGERKDKSQPVRSVDFCTWICTYNIYHGEAARGKVRCRWPAREDLAVREGGPPPLLHGGAGRSLPERAPTINLIATYPAPASRSSVISGG